ncbi:MAG: ATP phosphoribosyltransferase regulatory subunit, partial [Alcanivorax sp.]|nr:ATP phosphoribosyltransferase regulatory subunit [Alcanivorax sp.]
PGIEAGGIIEEVGQEVDASRIGERVVLALAGADNDPAELGCDRELVSAGDGWTLQSISS